MIKTCKKCGECYNDGNYECCPFCETLNKDNK